MSTWQRGDSRGRYHSSNIKFGHARLEQATGSGGFWVVITSMARCGDSPFWQESLADVEIQPPIGSSRTRIVLLNIAVHLHLGSCDSGHIRDLAPHCLFPRSGVSWTRTVENTWCAVKLHPFIPWARFMAT